MTDEEIVAIGAPVVTAVPPRPPAGEVGRCGNTSPSFIGAPPDICALPAGHPGWHRGDLPLHGRAPEWSTARSAAPDATAGDGLLRKQLMERIAELRNEPAQAAWTDEAIADDLLALPALRDVLAAAARDAEHEWQCPACGATTRARMADPS